MAATGCLFCQVVTGTAPAEVVFDEAGVVGFLDIRPLFPGHVLVVPRTHVETLADLPAFEVAPLFAAVQRVARAVEAAMGADGTFVANNNRVSQSVPHLHIHVVPRRFKDGLRGFMWPRQRYPDDVALAATGEAIRRALSSEPPKRGGQGPGTVL